MVIGYTFAATPFGDAPESAVLSHRIMRKNNYLNSEFGEESVVEQRPFLLALQGLSNEGKPMINPVDGEPTRFAFTGNPVDDEGWIDSPTDVRSLLSLKPFDIPGGESAEVLVAITASLTPSLEQAISEVTGKLEKVREPIAIPGEGRWR